MVSEPILASFAGPIGSPAIGPISDHQQIFGLTLEMSSSGREEVC